MTIFLWTGKFIFSSPTQYLTEVFASRVDTSPWKSLEVFTVDCGDICLEYFSRFPIFCEHGKILQVYSIADSQAFSTSHGVIARTPWKLSHFVCLTPCYRSASFHPLCRSQEETSTSWTPTPVIFKPTCAANRKSCPSLLNAPHPGAMLRGVRCLLGFPVSYFEKVVTHAGKG